jgi:hypothetical protein
MVLAGRRIQVRKPSRLFRDWDGVEPRDDQFHLTSWWPSPIGSRTGPDSSSKTHRPSQLVENDIDRAPIERLASSGGLDRHGDQRGDDGALAVEVECVAWCACRLAACAAAAAASLASRAARLASRAATSDSPHADRAFSMALARSDSDMTPSGSTEAISLASFAALAGAVRLVRSGVATQLRCAASRAWLESNVMAHRAICPICQSDVI